MAVEERQVYRLNFPFFADVDITPWCEGNIAPRYSGKKSIAVVESGRAALHGSPMYVLKAEQNGYFYPHCAPTLNVDSLDEALALNKHIDEKLGVVGYIPSYFTIFAIYRDINDEAVEIVGRKIGEIRRNSPLGYSTIEEKKLLKDCLEHLLE